MMPSWPLRAMVLSHDPDNDAMYVVLSSGQMFPFYVKRLYQGHVDSLRINKPPLPVRGSWGLVVFPHGDVRNGVWLGAYQPHQVDALTSEQADPFAEYLSHFSGHWSHVHGLSGYLSTQFADGSYVVAGSATSLPTMHRHIVDDDQQRQRVAFPFSDRNPNPQSTFAYTFVQSGVGFSIYQSASGSLLVNFSQGQSITFLQSGSNATITVDGSGNVTMKGVNTVTVDVPLANFTGDVHAKGNVIAGYGGNDSVTLQGHQHTQPQDSHGDTEQPTNAPTAGT